MNRALPLTTPGTSVVPRLALSGRREGRLGTPHSAEAWAKMSAAHRRRGTRPPKAGRPWTGAEDELVRTLPAAEAARRTGRTLAAVSARRRGLVGRRVATQSRIHAILACQGLPALHGQGDGFRAGLGDRRWSVGPAIPHRFIAGGPTNHRGR
jgi:hypothetical protein